MAIAPKDKFSRELTNNGVKLHHSDFARYKRSLVGRFLDFIQFRKLIKDINPDCVISFTSPSNIFFVILKYFLPSFKTIITISGRGSLFTNRGILGFLYRTTFKFLLRKSDAIFVQNEEDYLYANGVGCKSVTKVIGSGVDLSKFKIINKPFQTRRLKFFYIGRFLKSKGLDILLESVKILRQKEFADIEFYVLGFSVPGHEDSYDASELRALCCIHDVQLLGSTRSPEVEINKFDCLIMPTTYAEGTPKTILEAAACGRPSLVFDVPGCNDVIKHNINGWVVKDKTAHGLSAAIEMISSSSSDSLQIVSNNAHKLAKEHYSVAANTNSYLRVVDELFDD